MIMGAIMDNRGEFTRAEILSQPEAWRRRWMFCKCSATISRSLWQRGHYDHVIFTGCGSPYYLALAAAALFQELSGQPARALPASELWLSPRFVLRAQRQDPASRRQPIG